jgi:hypothetical protein
MSVSRYNLRASTRRSSALIASHKEAGKALIDMFSAMRSFFELRKEAEMFGSMGYSDDMSLSSAAARDARVKVFMARRRAIDVISHRVSLLYGTSVAARYKVNAIRDKNSWDLAKYERVARCISLRAPLPLPQIEVDDELFFYDPKDNRIWEALKDDTIGAWVGYYDSKDPENPIRYAEME